ncbi:MAG: hypothetical protein ABIP03_00715, partial [Aquihabitans sp.]
GPRPEPRPRQPRAVNPASGPSTSSVRFRRDDAGGGAAVAKAAPPVVVPSDPSPVEPVRPSRKNRINPAELLPPAPSPRTAFRQRYGVVYDTQGPRIRIGLLWAASVALALAFRPLRPYGLATLYAVVAGAAAMQVVDAWHEVRGGADRWVAALGASALPVLATLGVRPVGAALLLLVVAAVGVATQRSQRRMSLINAAGNTVLAAGLCGGATAGLVLLADYEIGAVIILVAFLMVYDASDYLVGSGADNGFEGPAAGAMSIAAVGALFAVTNAPPFRGVDIWSFASLAIIACPAGQILASAMLPSAGARAPALRRLDSLLIVAPAWAGLVGLYLQRAVG